MAAVFGNGCAFNEKNAMAMAELLAEMAWKLDYARDQIQDLKEELVTTRGNDV